jgi:hypothetical protein
MRDYEDVLIEARKAQGRKRPFIIYTRNTMWDGQPCAKCGSINGIKEVGGRFVAGSPETGDLMFLCGDCVEKHLDKDFEIEME